MIQKVVINYCDVKAAKLPSYLARMRGYGEKEHTRNEAVDALKADQLKQWKIDNGYHQHSLAEATMGRYKQLNSPMLSLSDYNGQVVEALAGVKAMNNVIRLGMPVRQQVT